MKIRPALAAAITAAAVFSTTSSAAPAPQVVDQPGDANAVNGQGIVTAAQGSPGPGSDDSRDILSVLVETTKEKGVCTGYTATVEYKGTPSSKGSMHRVRATTATYSSFLMQFSNDATEIRVIGGGVDKTIKTAKPATIVGNKIVFTIGLKDLTQVNEKSGTTLETLRAAAGANNGDVYLPVYDLASSDKNFKVCG